MNKKPWLAIPLLLATTAALAVDLKADAAPTATAAAPDTTPAEATPARPFIERSFVRYPTALGGHKLLNAQYGPENWQYGVGLTYAIADAPEYLRFDLFIYPVGRVPADDALAQIMAEVRAGIAEHEKKGTYGHVVMGEEAAFAMRPDSETAGAPTGKEDPAALVERAMAADAAPGRKLAMAFHSGDARMMSLAYGFYKHLFLVKVRASVADEAMATDQFEAAVDAAVRDLVAAVSVQNVGDCGGVPPLKVAVNKDDPEGGKQAINQALFELMSRSLRERCEGEYSPEPLPEGMGEQEVVYPPGIWDPPTTES